MDHQRADSHPDSEIDLSALAWVQDELRRSLEAAHKALRRFVKEYETVFDSDVDAVDPAVLRGARQQLHQGVGALELVGLPGGGAGAARQRGGGAALRRQAAAHQRAGRRRDRARVVRAARLPGPAAGRQAASRRCRCSRSTARCRSWPAPSACTRPSCGSSDWRWLDLPADPSAAPAGGRRARRSARSSAAARS